jgi:hypothetical protein
MKNNIGGLIFVLILCLPFTYGGCDGAPGDLPYIGSYAFTTFYGVAVDDLDLDGAVDAAVTFDHLSSGKGTEHFNRIILNDTNFPGSFSPSDLTRLQGSAINYPESITLGDLNDDGYSDIAIQNGRAILVLFQDSALRGQFFAPSQIIVGERTAPLAIGDLNEDGLNDIAIAGYGGKHLSILFQDSTNPGNFLPLVRLGISSNSVAIGDLNGDFINDMAVPWGDSVRLLFQDQSTLGTFFPPVALGAGKKSTDVKIGDLDKDGYQDIVVGNWDPSDNLTQGGISVLLQDSDNPGEFFSADDYDFICGARKISLGDLNDDGFLDIAVASRCSDCKITILFQDITNIGTFLSATRYSCKGDDPWDIAIGDMNSDTFNDLIISEATFVIRYQDSTSPGNFLERTELYDPTD